MVELSLSWVNGSCAQFVRPTVSAVILCHMRMASGRNGTLLRTSIGLGLIVVTVSFLGWSLASNWSDLTAEDVDFQPMLLVASALPTAAAILLLAFIWKRIVVYLAGSVEANPDELPKIFLYSWVGRYVPGKVAYLAGRFFLGRSVGFSAPVLVGSMVYENVLLVTTGAAFAMMTLLPVLAIESESILPYLALPLVVVGGAVFLHPRVLGKVVQLGARLLGREVPDDGWQISPGQLARLTAAFMVTHVVNGMAFYLLIISVTSYSPRYLPLAAGAFVLAGIAGMISVFAPAGIGVREGVIVAVLQTTMPVELAVFISVAARVWATIIDVVLVGGSFAYDYFFGDRMLLSALRGSPADDPGGVDS